MKDFEMSDLQLKSLVNAQSHVDREWEKLGLEMGFDPTTVNPNPKGARFFSADECS